VTPEQVRRARFAGAFFGVVAPPVLGALFGVVISVIHGSLWGAGVSFFFGAAAGMVVCSLPCAVIGGLGCWSLGTCLHRRGSSPAAARRSIIAMGALFGLLAPGVAALIIADGEFFSGQTEPDVLALFVVGLVGGGLAGELVWQHATSSPAADPAFD